MPSKIQITVNGKAEKFRNLLPKTLPIEQALLNLTEGEVTSVVF